MATGRVVIEGIDMTTFGDLGQTTEKATASMQKLGQAFAGYHYGKPVYFETESHICSYCGRDHNDPESKEFKRRSYPNTCWRCGAPR